MPEKIAARARQAIEKKVFPGCVIGIVRQHGAREVVPFGKLTYEKDSPDVTENTIYDLASVTKSIPVASLAAMFVESGRLSLPRKVRDYLPELQHDHGATIEDLLRYRVHGAQMSSLKFETFEQVRTYIFEHGFDGPPGDPEYTNLPAFLLGIVLERAGGEILPALAHKYFFGPLQMNNTSFFPADGRFSLPSIAPTEIVDGAEIHGVVHDESARKFAEKRRAVGHAGLFSTAPDLLNFLDALLQGKFPAIVSAAEDGLGWQREGDLLGHFEQGQSLLNNGSGQGRTLSGRFGKTGFTGTSVALDPEKEIGLVILSNRTYPQRPPDSDAINLFRSDIADAVFSS